MPLRKALDWEGLSNSIKKLRSKATKFSIVCERSEAHSFMPHRVPVCFCKQNAPLFLATLPQWKENPRVCVKDLLMFSRTSFGYDWLKGSEFIRCSFIFKSCYSYEENQRSILLDRPLKIAMIFFSLQLINYIHDN